LVLFAAAGSLWVQQDIDRSIVAAHNGLYEHALCLQAFELVSRYGMGVIALVYSLLAFLSSRREGLVKSRGVFLLIAFSFGLGGISGDLLKEVFDRARPAAELFGQILLTHVSDSPSFPSGHATKSMALALPFVILAVGKAPLIRALKLSVFVTALLVCYSRIALQRHFLSDVLAGIATALLFVLVARWVVNMFLKRQRVDFRKSAVLNRRLAFVFVGMAVIVCLI